MNYFSLMVRQRVAPSSPPLLNAEELSSRDDDTPVLLEKDDDVYLRAMQEEKPRVVHYLRPSSSDWNSTTTDGMCKRFKYSETRAAEDVVVVSRGRKLLTVQTEHLSSDDDEEEDALLLQRMRSLYVRRHAQETHGTSPYFAVEETDWDPNEDPLECFMEYENVWWRQRRRPKEPQPLSGDLF